ncbi:MAG TPA: outer membrane beta-barrel protein [Pontibacter sp.]
MKRLLALAIFGLISAGAFAQTSKGTIVVSGTAGFSNSQNSNDPQTAELNAISFNITPGIGYMLLDELEVGASVGYSFNKSTQVSDDKVTGVDYTLKSNTFNYGAYAKKYFVLSERIALTGLASAVISKGESSSEFIIQDEFRGSSETKVSNYKISLAPGATFFLNDKAGISASFGSLGYAKYTTKPKSGGSKSETTLVGLDLNSSTLALGFSYYISR